MASWIHCFTFKLGVKAMKISRRTQKIVISIYTLFFALLSLRGPSPVIVHKLIFAAILVTPGVLYLLGVDWCRFVVGTVAAVFLLFWSLSPLMQHAIDRHIGFWLMWAVLEAVLIATMIASFIRPKEKNDHAS